MTKFKNIIFLLIYLPNYDNLPTCTGGGTYGSGANRNITSFASPRSGTGGGISDTLQGEKSSE